MGLLNPTGWQRRRESQMADPLQGPLHIHVSKTFEDKEEKQQFYAQYPDAEIGGVAGIVELVNCVSDHPSRWAMPDCWHWVLQNPREVEFVPMKGKLGLFYYEKKQL